MTPHPLPSSLDTAAAAPLRQALLGRIERHQPLVLDGAAVTRVGLACLQVLASARASAREDGLAYRMDDASDALAGMAALAMMPAILEPLA